MDSALTLGFPTCADPRGDRAIKATIETSVDRILDGMGEGALTSIILIGAMTEGEGSVLLRPDREPTVLSDLDLYLVASRGADLAALKARAPVVARALRREVSEERVASSFDLAAVSYDEIAEVRPAIGTLDLRNRGRVIWGEDVLSTLPGLDPGAIPPRSAATLIFNRIAEELLYRPGRGGAADDMALYHAAKTGADLALAILSLLGEYRPTYRERAARLREVWNQPVLDWLRERVPDLPDQVGAWTEYKLRPDVRALRGQIGEGGGGAAESLAGALVPVVEAVWVWALRFWTGAREEEPLLLAEKIGRMETLRERVRGWKTAWQRGDLGWHAGGLWRMARGVAAGSPLSLLYSAASLVYFASPGRNGADGGRDLGTAYLRRARRLMPVPAPRTDGIEWESMRQVLVDYWRKTVMRGVR